MAWRLLADAVLVFHAAFIAFALLGGLTVLWRRALALPHLAALAWGTWVVATGRICPLTPLENQFRTAAGQQGYGGGFIEHYLVDAIYPPGLTRPVQVGLAVGLVLLNLGIYGWVLWRIRSAENETSR
ncbi:MAG: DUF2784 domain-containing protein [Pseudomonadota bacterium]